jgi:hypothetical protein
METKKIRADEVEVGDLIDTGRHSTGTATTISGVVEAIKPGPGEGRRRLVINGVDFAFYDGAPVVLIELAHDDEADGD